MAVWGNLLGLTGRRGRGPVGTSRLLRCENLEPRLLLHGGELWHAEGEEAASQVPDFALLDVNSTSTTFAQRVSPRDYLQKTSAWYFGYAST